MTRFDEIKKKIDLWFQFKLTADINDIMSDLVYLMEIIDQLQLEGKL